MSIRIIKKIIAHFWWTIAGAVMIAAPAIIHFNSSAPEAETSASSAPEAETSASSAPEAETSASSAPEAETSTNSAPEAETSTNSAPEAETSTSKIEVLPDPAPLPKISGHDLAEFQQRIFDNPLTDIDWLAEEAAQRFSDVDPKELLGRLWDYRQQSESVRGYEPPDISTWREREKMAVKLAAHFKAGDNYASATDWGRRAITVCQKAMDINRSKVKNLRAEGRSLELLMGSSSGVDMWDHDCPIDSLR
jgi:hypothetical protein